jgi:Helix-turn-helix family
MQVPAHDDQTAVTSDHVSRRLWRALEPYHAVTYFVPETRQRTDALGLKGGWMSYFACRAAPLGTVRAEVVAALFYNFHPDMVRRAIPDAWSYASPEALLEARLAAADQGLRRLLGTDVEGGAVSEAAELAWTAAQATTTAGRRQRGAALAARAAPATVAGRHPPPRSPRRRARHRAGGRRTVPVRGAGDGQRGGRAARGDAADRP